MRALGLTPLAGATTISLQSGLTEFTHPYGLGDEHRSRFLVHDRDTKFTHGFNEICRTEGIRVIRTPIQAPNANARAERWVRTLRADCLDRILILGRSHLEHVLRVYRHHYGWKVKSLDVSSLLCESSCRCA